MDLRCALYLHRLSHQSKSATTIKNIITTSLLTSAFLWNLRLYYWITTQLCNCTQEACMVWAAKGGRGRALRAEAASHFWSWRCYGESYVVWVCDSKWLLPISGADAATVSLMLFEFVVLWGCSPYLELTLLRWVLCCLSLWVYEAAPHIWSWRCYGESYVVWVCGSRRLLPISWADAATVSAVESMLFLLVYCLSLWFYEAAPHLWSCCC